MRKRQHIFFFGSDGQRRLARPSSGLGWQKLSIEISILSFTRNSRNGFFSAGWGVLAWIDWIMMPPTPHQPTLSLEIPETMKKSPGFVSRSTVPLRDKARQSLSMQRFYLSPIWTSSTSVTNQNNHPERCRCWRRFMTLTPS